MNIVKVTQNLYYQDVTDNIVTASLYPKKTDNILRKDYETATMSCIALPNELYFIDCGAITKITKKFREDMQNRFNCKTTHLLFTHDHWDHTFGMEAFSDINTVMSSVGIAYYKRNLNNGIYERYKHDLLRNYADDAELQESLPDAMLFVPNTGVPKQEQFGSKQNKIIFKVCGGHTKPSSWIYCCSEKTLFTGDNLTTSHPSFAWPITVIDTYKEWEQLEINNVVPGHGHIVDKNYILEVRKHFEELLEKILELKLQSLTVSQVLKHPDLPIYSSKIQKGWVKGNRSHRDRIRTQIKSWYGQVVKEAKEDSMFLS
ncbi:MAG: MBL fold metallo-hydrolase [Candidatus Hodarchaeales archaeon]